MFGETNCDIFGCQNKQVKLTDVTVTIGGITEQVEACDEHRDFFQTIDYDKYAIGKSFTGKVEVRPIPAQPAPPSPAPTEE